MNEYLPHFNSGTYNQYCQRLLFRLGLILSASSIASDSALFPFCHGVRLVAGIDTGIGTVDHGTINESKL